MKYFNLPVMGMVLFALFTACTTKPSKEAREFQAMFDEVIAVHDEVMPKMGKLNALSQQLKKETDTTTATYTEAVEGLQESHKAMMEWMKGFSEKFPYDDAPLKDKTPEEILQKTDLLKAEKDGVFRLRDLINQSIENAEQLLKKE